MSNKQTIQSIIAALEYFPLKASPPNKLAASAECPLGNE